MCRFREFETVGCDSTTSDRLTVHANYGLIAKSIMKASEREALDAALDGLDRLLKVFRLERILYLLVALTSFVILAYTAIQMLRGVEITSEAAGWIFGGGSLATIAASGVGYFLHRAFKLIEDIIRQFTGLK